MVAVRLAEYVYSWQRAVRLPIAKASSILQAVTKDAEVGVC